MPYLSSAGSLFLFCSILLCLSFSFSLFLSHVFTACHSLFAFHFINFSAIFLPSRHTSFRCFVLLFFYLFTMFVYRLHPSVFLQYDSSSLSFVIPTSILHLLSWYILSLSFSLCIPFSISLLLLHTHSLCLSLSSHLPAPLPSLLSPLHHLAPPPHSLVLSLTTLQFLFHRLVPLLTLSSLLESSSTYSLHGFLITLSSPSHSPDLHLTFKLSHLTSCSSCLHLVFTRLNQSSNNKP